MSFRAEEAIRANIGFHTVVLLGNNSNIHWLALSIAKRACRNRSAQAVSADGVKRCKKRFAHCSRDVDERLRRINAGHSLTGKVKVGKFTEVVVVWVNRKISPSRAGGGTPQPECHHQQRYSVRCGGGCVPHQTSPAQYDIRIPFVRLNRSYILDIYTQSTQAARLQEIRMLPIQSVFPIARSHSLVSRTKTCSGPYHCGYAHHHPHSEFSSIC
ncbi:hypothetical protein P152DRAFT_14931 [Eremomyces bilateralis CBS 781.70]|uniref:Uncharacterized protein n=1 Tax=Eremomyces bilateralis CBS 781.70 TaxID=1392243 RepID=A0A6G1GGS9_9PEZI|nr:uncharacterized protein P152DRAFT_14931 [Eremomyces bilateralis CBS 781.70]KAF1817305.1 hypothetical protein P152DRAFT_14931 [Eremomyces bilateralis CBS 781.70]